MMNSAKKINFEAILERNMADGQIFHYLYLYAIGDPQNDQPALIKELKDSYDLPLLADFIEKHREDFSKKYDVGIQSKNIENKNIDRFIETLKSHGQENA